MTTDQFIKMWNGVQVHGFLIKVKHAVGDEEWQRRSKKAEAKLAELTKKVEKVEELRSAVEEAKTENLELYGKLVFTAKQLKSFRNWMPWQNN